VWLLIEAGADDTLQRTARPSCGGPSRMFAPSGGGGGGGGAEEEEEEEVVVVVVAVFSHDARRFSPPDMFLVCFRSN
jgi:hypothetical protein